MARRVMPSGVTPRGWCISPRTAVLAVATALPPAPLTPLRWPLLPASSHSCTGCSGGRSRRKETGRSARLFCQGCHVPDENGKRMLPVTYEAHCESCHNLGYSIPHASPEVVHRSLLALTVEELSATQADPTAGRLRPPRDLSPQATPFDVVRQVQIIERHLYGAMCGLCHRVDNNAKPLPRILPVKVQAVWLPEAKFSHRAHRALDCESCHNGVSKSQQAADVHIPGIEVCRSCHGPDTPATLAQHNHAPTGCVTCHRYHNPSQDRTWKESMATHDLRG